MSLLSTDALSVSIAGRAICQSLTLGLGAGQCWGMLGSNGAGKTTLLHTLAGLRAPAAGSVLVEGCRMTTMTRRQIARVLGLLPQDNVDPFPATVLETALIGRHPHLSAWQRERTEDVAIARAALADVELDRLLQRQVDTLSGGERRRLALATLFTQQPRVWLLDEPTNHLDLRFQIKLLGLMQDKAAEQNSVVLMSLHDVNLAARFCHAIMLLFPDGTIAHGPVQTMLTAGNLQRLYGYPVTMVAGPAGPVFVPG